MTGEENRCLIVVRLRGSVNLRRDVKDTLRMLHLNRVNHATVIPSTPEYLGMLQKVKDHTTWGEASKETLNYLLEKRGEVEGGIRLTDKYLKDKNYGSIKDVAEALHELKLKLKDLKGIRPTFRLHPPSKGYKKTLKRSFTDGGETGYRGEKINELVKRMA
jgi:large subunit ribosomal protein L30